MLCMLCILNRCNVLNSCFGISNIANRFMRSILYCVLPIRNISGAALVDHRVVNHIVSISCLRFYYKPCLILFKIPLPLLSLFLAVSAFTRPTRLVLKDCLIKQGLLPKRPLRHIKGVALRYTLSSGCMQLTKTVITILTPSSYKIYITLHRSLL